MIHSPRRSVTRFFIPLLDVMILLFSMFMLMPIVEKASEASGEQTAKSAADLELTKLSLEKEVQRLGDRVRLLEKEQKPAIDLKKMDAKMKELQKEVAQLRTEKIKALQQRLAIKILEIDDSGRLVYFEPGVPPKKRVIDSKQAAADLIRKQQQEIAQDPKGPARELYYLCVFPSPDAVEDARTREYESWFQNVPFEIKYVAAATK